MKKKHGGKRKGAGRPPIPPNMKKESRTITLSKDAWERIDSKSARREQSRNRTIEEMAQKLPLFTG